MSDVFHTGSPDSALWEFKHGNGNFRRGDLVGLREIKRRASRHALIHRDSFPSHKTAVSQPGTPAEPVPDATEARLMTLEHTLYDMHNRLSRAEEGNVALNSKCQGMAESLAKCYHVSSHRSGCEAFANIVNYGGPTRSRGSFWLSSPIGKALYIVMVRRALPVDSVFY